MPEFELDGRRPRVHPDAYIAPTAVLIGDVEVQTGASIWFGVVLRGDESSIVIGEGSNVQDNSMIHCSHNLPTILGRNVTVGHLACLEGCTVDDGGLGGSSAPLPALSNETPALPGGRVHTSFPATKSTSGWASRVRSIAAAHSGLTRTSSSTNATTGLRAACDPALRARDAPGRSHRR